MLYEPPKREGSSRIIRAVQPIYPEQARQALIEGWVQLAYTINTNGRAENILVIKEYPNGVFSKAAIDALKEFTFQPQSVNGVPVSIDRFLIINFKLSQTEKLNICESARMANNKTCREIK